MHSFSEIGFAGIGLMGRPIVHRLLGAGYTVHVWNRSPAKLAEVTGAGAKPAATPAQLAQRCDIVMLCLADTGAVRDVVFGADGIAHGASADRATRARLVVDLSSIDPGATREMAASLADRCGMGWVDAPVSGGVIGAEQGTLAVMAGGGADDVESLTGLMQSLSRGFTHMGPTGSGQLTKLCNQMIVGCNVLVLAEVIGFARRAGIDAARLPEALAGGFADSIPLQMTGPMMAGDETEPIRWHVRTLLKDLDTATAVARQFDSSTPLTALAAERMRRHGERGFLDADPATLVGLYTDADD